MTTVNPRGEGKAQHINIISPECVRNYSRSSHAHTRKTFLHCPEIPASPLETLVTLPCAGALPQKPLLHSQWNISASLTWHAPSFLQGFGWQGLLPHSPTPLPYRLSPPLFCRLSTRLLTSSRRMQPTRPVSTAVLSRTLGMKRRRVHFHVQYVHMDIFLAPDCLKWTQ